jgi:hypothetical protein
VSQIEMVLNTLIKCSEAGGNPWTPISGATFDADNVGCSHLVQYMCHLFEQNSGSKCQNNPAEYFFSKIIR